MKAVRFFVLVTLVFLAAGAVGQDGGIEKNVVYGTVDGVELKMDLAKPPASSGPCPALLCIHGGAWESGSKDGYAPFISQFAARGYRPEKMTNVNAWFSQRPSRTPGSVRLFCRVTGAESMNCALGAKRTRPQIDRLL